MPKPNVDKVTLVATQELATVVTPTKTWWVPLGDPAPGSKFTRKGTIETLGTIISEQIGAVLARPDRVYQIGGDMPDGSSIELDGDDNPTILKDPYLDGLIYSAHLRGVEYLIKGDEWQNDVVDGGLRYTDGRIFEEGQVLTISFKPEISNILVAPDAVARFTSGMQEITADTVAGPSYDRKLIILNSATSPALYYTLNPVYPENVLCSIITSTGLQKQSVIVAPAGQDIYHNGVQSSFILGQADYVQLERIGPRWYVTSNSDRWVRVGHIVFGGIPGPGSLSANGQTLQISHYPGVDLYLTKLNAALPGSVISVGAWATDNTKWGRDATTIKVPNLGGWYPRFLDLGNGKDTDRVAAGTGSIVGSKQAQSLLQHNHNAAGGFSKLLKPSTGAGSETAATFGPSGRPVTWPNITTSADMASVGGSQNNTENVGLPAIIYIQ